MNKILSVALTAVIIFLVSCKDELELPASETDNRTLSLNTRLKIIIDGDFKMLRTESGSDTTFVSFKEIMESIFRETGFEVIDQGETIPCVTLKIKVQALPKTGSYRWEHGSFISSYEGASIYGSFVFLDSLGVEFENVSFSGAKEPPQTILSINKDAARVPFRAALLSSNLFKSLAEVIQKNYSNDAVVFYWISYLRNDLLFPGRSVWRDEAKYAIQDIETIKFTDVRTIKPILEFSHLFSIDTATDAIAKMGTPAVDTLISALTLNQNKKYNKKYFWEYKKDQAGRYRYYHELWFTARYKEAFAACALGKIKDRRAIDVLTKALKSETPRVRYWSSFALVHLGESQKASATINEFTAENLGTESKTWADWWKRNGSKFN